MGKKDEGGGDRWRGQWQENEHALVCGRVCVSVGTRARRRARPSRALGTQGRWTCKWGWA